MMNALRAEIRPMLRLALPLAMAELGWMAMGFVDTLMAGRLSAAAMGAGSLGNMLFFPIAICGTGMLLGMDTLVAQAYGAREPRTVTLHAARAIGLGFLLGAFILAVQTPLVEFALRLLGGSPILETRSL